MLAIATLLTSLLQHVVNDFVVPAGALVLVIAITALLWGWGPALLLFFLGMLILEHFVFEPYRMDVLSWPNVLQVLPFAFAVLVINILSFQRDRGWVKARLSATEHQHAREELTGWIDMIPQLVWIARPDGFIESGNQHVSIYLGVPLKRFNGDQWFDFIHPDDRQKTWEVWQTALRTGHPHEVEHRVLEGSTHTFRWFLTRAIPHKDARGTILKWFGTCTDIDDQINLMREVALATNKADVLPGGEVLSAPMGNLANELPDQATEDTERSQLVLPPIDGLERTSQEPSTEWVAPVPRKSYMWRYLIAIGVAIVLILLAIVLLMHR